MDYKKYRGNTTDIRCKANINKLITIKTCKNNCKQWDFKNKRCKLGYSPKDN